MDRLQKIIENGAWLLSDKIARLLLGVFVIALIARGLGPTDFGIWNYAIALTTITGALAGLGLDKVLTKALVKDPGNAAGLLSTSFFLRTGAALGSGFLCWVLVRLFHKNDPGAGAYLRCTLILSLGVLLQSFDIFDSYYQAGQRVRLVMIPKTGAFLLFCAVRVLFVRWHKGLFSFAWLSVWELLAGYIVIGLIYARETRKRVAPGRLMPQAKELLSQSWPLIFTNLSILVYMKVDQLLLDGMTNAAQLGEYVAATRLSELWYALPMAAATALLPALILQRKQYPERYGPSIERWLRLSFWASAGLCLCVTLLAEPLSRWLYGQAFPRTGYVLQIHIWASIPVFMGIVLTQYLIIEGQYKAILYSALAGIIVNIGFNLVLIHPYGSVGAAVATVLSYVAVYGTLVFSDRRKNTFVFMAQIGSPKRLWEDMSFFRTRLLKG